MSSHTLIRAALDQHNHFASRRWTAAQMAAGLHRRVAHADSDRVAVACNMWSVVWAHTMCCSCMNGRRTVVGEKRTATHNILPYRSAMATSNLSAPRGDALRLSVRPAAAIAPPPLASTADCRLLAPAMLQSAQRCICCLSMAASAVLCAVLASAVAAVELASWKDVLLLQPLVSLRRVTMGEEVSKMG